MKKLVFIFLIFIYGFNVYSQTPAYVLLPNNRHLALGERPIYYVLNGPTIPNVPLTNIIDAATNQVNPAFNIEFDRAPNIYYAGTSFSATALMVQMGPVSTTALGNNSILGGGSGAQTSWVITLDYLRPWVNGAVPGQFDIGTVYRHEVVHGVGLDHVCLNCDRLMSTQQQAGDIDLFGSGEVAGYRKIYLDINCNDCDTGAVLFTKEVKDLELPNQKQINWDIENRGVSDEFILGFNVLKETDGQFHTLNEKIIFAEVDKLKYSFVLNDYNQEENYFIEIVTDSKDFNRFIKLNENE